MPSRRVPLAAGAVLATLLTTVTACSNGSTVAQGRPHNGSGTASAVDGLQQITITTGNDLRFHPSTIVVHPGRVRVVLENTAKPGNGPPHNVVITGLPGQVPAVSAGSSGQYEFNAPAPGRYRMVCTFHVAQGQTGTLVVESG